MSYGILLPESMTILDSDSEDGMASLRKMRMIAAQGRVVKDGAPHCPVCGDRMVGGEVDHKQPKSRDGTDLVENLWVICRDCNREKRNQTLYEFLLRRMT